MPSECEFCIAPVYKAFYIVVQISSRDESAFLSEGTQERFVLWYGVHSHLLC